MNEREMAKLAPGNGADGVMLEDLPVNSNEVMLDDLDLDFRSFADVARLMLDRFDDENNDYEVRFLNAELSFEDNYEWMGKIRYSDHPLPEPEIKGEYYAYDTEDYPVPENGDRMVEFIEAAVEASIFDINAERSLAPVNRLAAWFFKDTKGRWQGVVKVGW